MNKVKNALKNKVLKYTTRTALCAAFGIFGIMCSTWLHQPQIPQKLIDIEMQ